jgi:hypothetical protein
MVQWSLTVSEDIDQSVRQFLAAEGGKDISAFVEEVVRRELFHQKLQAIKKRNAQYSQQEIMDTVDEAVSSIRASRS